MSFPPLNYAVNFNLFIAEIDRFIYLFIRSSTPHISPCRLGSSFAADLSPFGAALVHLIAGPHDFSAYLVSSLCGLPATDGPF